MQSQDAVLERRSASVWTKIHPIFALGQLGVFIVSLGMLGLYFFHIVPLAAVNDSVLVKVAFMILAILTGSLWEHDVYGYWWFAPQFLVEDVMTANVLLLHAGYLATYYLLPNHLGVVLALLGLAYAVYGLNVGQYILSHLRMQRSERATQATPGVAA